MENKKFMCFSFLYFFYGCFFFTFLWGFLCLHFYGVFFFYIFFWVSFFIFFPFFNLISCCISARKYLHPEVSVSRPPIAHVIGVRPPSLVALVISLGLHSNLYLRRRRS